MKLSKRKKQKKEMSASEEQQCTESWVLQPTLSTLSKSLLIIIFSVVIKLILKIDQLNKLWESLNGFQ